MVTTFMMSKLAIIAMQSGVRSREMDVIEVSSTEEAIEKI